MKTYEVILHIEEIIKSKNEEEAKRRFWDIFENAVWKVDIKEVKEKEMTKKFYNKVYDRKIKVECNTCKKIYTKWANEKLDHTADGTECKCKPNFTILEEIKIK